MFFERFGEVEGSAD